MTQQFNYNRVSHNLDAIRSDGVPILANNDKDPTTFGLTLANGTTVFIPFGADRTPVPAQTHVNNAHLKWDNAVALTITLEECSFPRFSPSDQANGIDDVTDHSVVAGNWIPVKPPDAYVEVTGGGTYTVATGVVAVTAGQQGGCTFNLSLWGARRGRIKIVVTTGGLVRAALHGKAAA